MHYTRTFKSKPSSKQYRGGKRTITKATPIQPEILIALAFVVAAVMTTSALFLGRLSYDLTQQVQTLQHQVSSLQTRMGPPDTNISKDSSMEGMVRLTNPIFINSAVIQSPVVPVPKSASTDKMIPRIEPEPVVVEEPAPVPSPVVINTKNLTAPSNLTVEQIDSMIQAALSKYGYADKGSIFLDTAQSLYNAEQTYGINAIYILAVGTWEGGWGTSNAARNKYNPFGLMTNSGIMSFSSVDEGIMDFARRMREYYFDCGRTEPYSIGKKYCPPNSTRWGDKITLIMSMYADCL